MDVYLFSPIYDPVGSDWQSRVIATRGTLRKVCEKQVKSQVKPFARRIASKRPKRIEIQI